MCTRYLAFAPLRTLCFVLLAGCTRPAEPIDGAAADASFGALDAASRDAAVGVPVDARAGDAALAADGGGAAVQDAALADAGPRRADCRRGLAYGFDPDSAAADVAALAPGIGWYYGWAPAPSSAMARAYIDAGVEFVPMVWGGSFDVEDYVARIPEGAAYLLGFNEPNFHAQANLTPEEAAARWPDVEAIADRRGLTLVSPAVNYCGGGCNVEDPFEWLDRFFAACVGCRVDHIAAHWYACSGGALEWYVSQFEKYGKPLWLTEFSCGDEGVQPVARQREYMAAALAFLESSPLVFRYAWFSGRTDAIANVDLLAGGGSLTTLGQDYVAQAAAATCPTPRAPGE